MSPQLNPNGVNVENGWTEFFEKAFAALKVKFSEIYPFDEDGEVSPDVLALRDAIFKLPCPIKVLALKFDETKFAHVKDGIGYLLRYDLSRVSKKQIEEYGMVDADNRETLKTVLIDKFGFQEDQVANFISDDFKTVGMWDDKFDCYIHFAHYDIRRNFEGYLHDLIMIFLYNIEPHLLKKFKREIYFNTLYNLEKDDVLSLEVFARKGPILDNFVRLEDGIPRKITIEDLQKDISTIQLIQSVPEEVKRIFKAAKELYVFGFFRYYFFTISTHYASLAIESAIRHRYNQWLGEKAVLICDHRNKDLRHEMYNPSYRRISDFCWQNGNKGWKCDKLKVNEEAFPSTMKRLLDWLVEQNIQTKWQRTRLKSAIDTRNALSHLESALMFLPSIIELKRAAELINNLYHQNT